MATVIFASCLMHMVALYFWFFCQRFALLPQPLGFIICLETLEFDLLFASTVLKLPSVVISLVNAESLAAVGYVKSMKAYSVSP